VTEVFTEATRYEVSCIPAGHQARRHLVINVEWRSPGLWAVVTPYGDCLSADGTWGWESQPSSRTDDWLIKHRFSLSLALRLAAEQAPKLTVMGLTVEDVLAGKFR
jgi:hypothetical protein